MPGSGLALGGTGYVPCTLASLTGFVWRLWLCFALATCMYLLTPAVRPYLVAPSSIPLLAEAGRQSTGLSRLINPPLFTSPFGRVCWFPNSSHPIQDLVRL